MLHNGTVESAVQLELCVRREYQTYTPLKVSLFALEYDKRSSSLSSTIVLQASA